MIARICNFQVGLCRGQKDAAIRTVDLFVECEDDPNVRRVFLRYFDKKQDSLGFVNAVKDNLLVFLPLEDFELTRQLLAGDAEVFFAWIADVEGKLVWAEITTAQEPLRSCHLEGTQGIHLVPSEDRQVLPQRHSTEPSSPLNAENVDPKSDSLVSLGHGPKF